MAHYNVVFCQLSFSFFFSVVLFSIGRSVSCLVTVGILRTMLSLEGSSSVLQSTHALYVSTTGLLQKRRGLWATDVVIIVAFQSLKLVSRLVYIDIRIILSISVFYLFLLSLLCMSCCISAMFFGVVYWRNTCSSVLRIKSLKHYNNVVVVDVNQLVVIASIMRLPVCTSVDSWLNSKFKVLFRCWRT